MISAMSCSPALSFRHGITSSSSHICPAELMSLLPSSTGSSQEYSVLATQLLNLNFPSPSLPSILLKGLSFPTVQMSIPSPIVNLNIYYVLNIILFFSTVALLSWMLDSHHPYDEMDVVSFIFPTSNSSDSKKSCLPSVSTSPEPSSSSLNPTTNTSSNTTPAPTSATTKPTRIKTLNQIRHRRRATLETIATLINLEDAYKRNQLISPITQSPTPSPNAIDLGIEGVDLDVKNKYIPSTFSIGESVALLQEIDQGLQKIQADERRRRALEIRVRSQLIEVDQYDEGVVRKLEEAERRRKGSWKTSLLLRVRIPVRWIL